MEALWPIGTEDLKSKTVIVEYILLTLFSIAGFQKSLIGQY
jgi:hypothetical protein